MTGQGASVSRANAAVGGVLAVVSALAAWAVVVLLGAAAGCAVGQRPSGAAYGRLPVEDESPEPRSIEEWEARQLQHADALSELAGLRRRSREGESRRREPRGLPSAGGQAPSRPVGPVPATVPVAQPDSPTAPPPPAADRTSTTRAEAQQAPSLRCRQICRHVRAICEAAGRICRIAGTLGEAPAREACRRGEARCIEARGLAGRLCPSCPSEADGTRDRPWRWWRSFGPKACVSAAVPPSSSHTSSLSSSLSSP